MKSRLDRAEKSGRRLPHAALLILSVVLAGAVVFLTWPARAAVFCEQLPQLTALAVCAATLLVFSFRAVASARRTSEDWRIAGGAAILAAMAFFLSVRFVTQYRQPCIEVQRNIQHPATAAPSQTR